ncbi:MAG: hypothetical protein QM831_12980 [Kofleriaceae bacterium]
MPVSEVELFGLLEAGSYERATTLAIETYGPELLGWLCAGMPESDAHDAFAMFGEELWKSLPKFDRRCSVRTWCYMLARVARARVIAAPKRQREVLVSSIPSVVQAVTQVLSTTRRQHELQQNVYAQIRNELDEEDQILLVLRVDKELPWLDIALVLLGPEATSDQVTAKSATLRKQFERVKVTLKELAARHMRD